MAIQKGTNPIVFDGTTQAITEKIYVTSIAWVGGTTAAHVAQLNVSSGGALVFYSRIVSAVANVDFTTTVDSWIDGLYVTTLDSGKIIVYHK